MAAIYDEQNRMPTYEFMHGIIGKSYAFETASRYGISNKIVSEAKAIYGDNSEKLNILIERGSQLERELKQKPSTRTCRPEKVSHGCWQMWTGKKPDMQSAQAVSFWISSMRNGNWQSLLMRTTEQFSFEHR